MRDLVDEFVLKDDEYINVRTKDGKRYKLRSAYDKRGGLILLSRDGKLVKEYQGNNDIWLTTEPKVCPLCNQEIK